MLGVYLFILTQIWKQNVDLVEIKGFLVKLYKMFKAAIIGDDGCVLMHFEWSSIWIMKAK